MEITKTDIEKINESLGRLEDVADAYKAARREAWDAIAAFLKKSGPVSVVLSKESEEAIRRELEALPEFEREVMAQKGGPGYIEALRAESYEMEYSTDAGPAVGIIQSVRLDDGIRVTAVDPFNGEVATIGIDDMVDAAAQVLLFISRFSKADAGE